MNEYHRQRSKAAQEAAREMKNRPRSLQQIKDQIAMLEEQRRTGRTPNRHERLSQTEEQGGTGSGQEDARDTHDQGGVHGAV